MHPLIGACFFPIKRVLPRRLNGTVQARGWHRTDPAAVTAIIVLGSRPSSSQTRSRGPAYLRSFASGVWPPSVTTCGRGGQRRPQGRHPDGLGRSRRQARTAPRLAPRVSQPRAAVTLWLRPFRSPVQLLPERLSASRQASGTSSFPGRTGVLQARPK